MSVFDACIDTDIKLIHVRQEAAAVHMADAWARLTGEVGVAMVTAGPGFANALSALYVARMAESPVVLLAGHAPLNQLGKGAFQEMNQADMASHVTKASWVASDSAKLGHDMTRAFQIASSGRHGPVQVSLPADVVEGLFDSNGTESPSENEFISAPKLLENSATTGVTEALSKAQRPLILTGPSAMRNGSDASNAIESAIGVPVIGMESPRGVNDPSLGAFAEVLAQADLIALVGKKLDFSLGFGNAPGISSSCQFVQIDSDEDAVELTKSNLDDTSRLTASHIVDPVAALDQIAQAASHAPKSSDNWLNEVKAATSYRPSEWSSVKAAPGQPMHAIEICRAVQQYLEADENAIYVSDGGEVGQWAQACLKAGKRVINGQSGSIGSAIPFALAAREAFPNARIVTMLGDGTFGFHAPEFDTAFRAELPFIAVVGNDSTWNAEYQIQLREYGEDRLIGCELLPARYDQLAESLGGHGEHVTSSSDLASAIERAHASGLPACVNVSMERNPAPLVRRG